MTNSFNYEKQEKNTTITKGGNIVKGTLKKEWLKQSLVHVAYIGNKNNQIPEYKKNVWKTKKERDWK